MEEKVITERDQDLISESPVCEVECIHPDLINKYSGQIIDVNHAIELSELFKTLGYPTRGRIMVALS